MEKNDSKEERSRATQPGPKEIDIAVSFKSVLEFRFRRAVKTRPEGGTPNITSPGRIHRRKRAGTATGARWPYPYRARPHIVQSLLAHTRSKLEQNGRRAATTARLLLYKTAKAKSG